ncbi:MAG TPA: DUF6600 domain-containing protein [Ramlibacter sp.]|nr:DUF6600 domain-containing protein [Ramlibacter sp.]
MYRHPHPIRSIATRFTAFMALAFASTFALAEADPPARVAALSHMEGSVVFAPAGETEWADAALNRPVTVGDRLWTDKGARAEMHLGSAALQLDSQTFVEVVNLDDDVLQATLKEGTVNARVRQLGGGENFEIDTPQLAFRASQPGDYRVDVDPAGGTTRVTVRSGAAVVYGTGGGTMTLQAGQQIAFAGRDLQQVAVAPVADDSFDRWATARSRAEDQSITARYVPREVVGYQALDANGTWAQDASYGAVWYPRVTVADWAPYRYGRWDWVAPWGWTWIDDAPWGFAPFHYGRWAHIGSRWAWVPGRIGPRPVYSPALVVFVGGGGSLWAGSGPGIGWFPLAPGEAWRPTYRTSSFYLRNVNRNIVVAGGFNGNYFYQRRPDAITSVRVEDFNRGRVHTHWNRLSSADLARTQMATHADMPAPRRWHDSGRSANVNSQPRSFGVGPAILNRPMPPATQQQQQQAQVQQQRQWQYQQQQRAQVEQRVRDEQVRQQHVQREQAVRQQRIFQQQQQQAVHEQQQRHRGWQQHQQAVVPQQRAVPQQHAVQPQRHYQPPAAIAAPAPQQQREGRGHGRGGWQQNREERAEQGGERGHGRGHRFN